MNKSIKATSYRLLALVIAVGASCWSATAQELPEEKVEVVKDYEARIIEANKVVIPPEEVQEERTLPNFQYNIAEKILPITYQPPTLKPLSMKTEELPKAYQGFLKAGFGYPTSPYLDAGYAFADADDRSLLARVSHHSATDNNIDNLRFSDNDALLRGRIVTSYGFAIEGQASLSLDNSYFYGYNRSDTSFTKDEVSNRLTDVGLGLKIYNVTENPSKVNYWAHADVYRFSNEFDTRETGLELDLGLTKWLGNFPITVSIGTDQASLQDSSGRRTLSNFYFGPSFTFGTDALRAKIGVRLGSDQEDVKFYPDVELLLNLAGNNLSVFVGAAGNLQKNTFKTFSLYNPFMVSHISDVRNSSYYDFYGGLRGLFSGLEFSLQAGFKPTTDLGLFTVNQDLPWARFDAVYDTVDIIYFQGSLKGELFPKFFVGGNLTINRYSTTQQEKAWFLPQLQAKANVTYLTLGDKLRLKGDLFVRDAVPFQEIALEDQPNALLDMSVGADFFVLENIGFFLQLNNLAANRYRRWYNYPTVSFNILGGVTARF
ncbi:MAG: hypothetical protein KTR24_06205 [Saprospiraceae bacterium]|nr:hypothetical protein [Saprospiraceae bacterium]